MPRVTKPIRIFPKIAKGRLSGSIKIAGVELKARVTRIEVVPRVTVAVNTAKFEIANIKNAYTNKWNGGEKVEIYADFSTGTTKIFEGPLVRPRDIFERFPAIEVNANGYGIEAFNNPVFKKYDTATDIGQIAKELIEEYLPAHTTTNIDTSTGVTATPIWQGKDLFLCLKDLALLHGDNNYVFYCDFDKDWHFFLKGSLKHGPTSGIAIVYGQNHISTNLERPFLKRRNKITVVGKGTSGVQLIATAKDDADIAAYWTIAEVIRDTNLTTQEEVENMAAYLLSVKSNVGRSGTVKADGLPGALPGYQIMIFDPNNNMNGYFHMTDIRHVIDRRFTTTVTIHEQLPVDPEAIAILKESIDKEQRHLDVVNEFGMENSYPFTFDSATGLNFTNTEIINSQLVLAAGKSSGTVETDAKTHSENITYVVLRAVGSDLNGVTFEVSIDNGLSWDDIDIGERVEPATTGNKLKLRATLTKTAAATNPQLDSMSGEYK